jgi:hypothetical protein
MVPIHKLAGRLGNSMFQYAYLHAQVREGKIPDIYVQSEEYFIKYRNEIKMLFGSDIGKINMVAIHVRRGDYVNNSFYVDLTQTGYYPQAMEMFPDASFLVFSDDIKWCMEQPMFANCEFSVGLNEIEDMNLMASCVGHIIANSSFSWWAAYIATNTKKVVAPKAWYTDGISRTTCPSKWIRI